VGTTLAATYEGFLADAHYLDHLRPHTLRAYRYELALAAAADRFATDLDALSLADLERWIARDGAAPSTIGRRAATFRRFFSWALRHGHCTRNPMAGYGPLKVRRGLPRPIREEREQRALDAAIAAAPPPYGLILTILRETGMRAGEVLALRRGDVTLDPGRGALRVREPKNGAERAATLPGDLTPPVIDIGHVAYSLHGGQTAEVRLGNGATTTVQFSGPIPDSAVDKEVPVPLSQHGCQRTCDAIQVFFFDGSTVLSTCVYQGEHFHVADLRASPNPPCLEAQ
jgi:integrase